MLIFYSFSFSKQNFEKHHTRKEAVRDCYAPAKDLLSPLKFQNQSSVTQVTGETQVAGNSGHSYAEFCLLCISNNPQ